MASPSQQFLDDALRAFARDFVRNRHKDIVRSNLEDRGKLLSSLKAQVLNQPERGLYMMVVAFSQYGRIQDMQKRSVSYKNAGGKEMVDLLSEWVQHKGLEKFKRGKYAKQYEGRSPQRIANMIAWGTIKKLKAKGKRQKRGWYNTGKEKDINTFYDYLLKGYKDAIQLELSQKLSA